MAGALLGTPLRPCYGRCYRTVTNRRHRTSTGLSGHPTRPLRTGVVLSNTPVQDFSCRQGQGPVGRAPSPPPKGGRGTARNFTTQQQTCKTPVAWLALAHHFGALPSDTSALWPPSVTLGNVSTAQWSPLRHHTTTADTLRIPCQGTAIRVSSLQEGCSIPTMENVGGVHCVPSSDW